MAKSNRVRIVGGAWRSRLLPFPEVPGLRPTPDRVRETLFNWLGQMMDGKTCLDLFSGSGALGFEAASRGAKQVVMVERDAKVACSLRDNTATLHAENCELVVADALKFLDQETRRFDVIFVDPPYDFHLLPRVLPLLLDRLTEDGMVYTECDTTLEIEPEWQVWRSGKAGQVHYYLLRKAS
ncbi:methyltransferase [Sulfurimicrobium lacus]|uniref:Methyltransferase n=1 Tax=Sulfurimicrobium lacus TaxID=2715678 RepID=A0A6F8VHL4_9PROT|nr:16S rRNA (guanine(966)-N(2))-methyltransferase RsmD [Sulfurimicrobium lacus]BCB28516.1 methyltransferase [Sulfurimicrobium lacus]